MAANVLDAVRRPVKDAIADAVRARISGPKEDRPATIERIWRAPGPRWFCPDDPIWVVHAHPAMMVGGLRALFVQSLHPAAMAGVAGHSGFRGDPWGRLQRTGNFIAVTTYATIPDAERLLARIGGIHRRVSGVDERGRPYAAADPHLLAWVHAAEAQSFLLAYQTYAAQPLAAEDADRYVAQVGSVSARLGVLEAPRTVAELESVLAAYRPELEASAAALDAADFLVHDPPVSGAARVGYRPFVAGALAITPPWARVMLRLSPGFGGSVGVRSARVQSVRVQAAQMAAVRRFVGVLDWAMDHPAFEPLPEGWVYAPQVEEPAAS